jgi:hypothetical protein
MDNKMSATRLRLLSFLVPSPDKLWETATPPSKEQASLPGSQTPERLLRLQRERNKGNSITLLGKYPLTY